MLRQPVLEPERDDGLADLRAPAARRPPAGLPREQQLRDLLRDRRAALDDAAARGVGDAARAIAIGSTPGCDRNRTSSAASVARTSGAGSARRDQRSPRSPGADRASYSTLAVPIDDDRRRPRVAIEQTRPAAARGEATRSEQRSRRDASAEQDIRNAAPDVEASEARTFSARALAPSRPVSPASQASSRSLRSSQRSSPPRARSLRARTSPPRTCRPRVNVPAVVARTRYENSWRPSLSRVAKSTTRSSYFST